MIRVLRRPGAAGIIGSGDKNSLKRSVQVSVGGADVAQKIGVADVTRDGR